MKWILAVLVALFVATPALAWGDQGHSLTCQIAYDLMTPAAKQEVDRLLALQAPRYRSFPNACTYPDDVKDTDGRRSQHFVNLRRTDRALPGLACPVADAPTDCLLPAIKEDYGVLRNAASSDAAKSLALMYLGHWLGDLHQPLHVSYKDDIGGGAIKTTGYCGSSKLHSIWDTCIIVKRIYANVPGRAMIDDPRFVATAEQLAQMISSTDKQSWQAGEPWQWANESYTIARKKGLRYCVLRAAGTCARPTTWGDRDQPLEIDDAYLDDFAPTVTQRLQMGGSRLASLLNRAFDPQAQ